MTTTVQAILEAAFARSTNNDPGKLATEAELIGVTNRIYQTLYALMAVAKPDAFVSRTTATMTGSPATTSLPSADLLDLRRVQMATGGVKVTVLPLEEVDKPWHLPPAVYRQGVSLVSRGLAGDPLSGDVLTLWVLDTPLELSVLVQALDPRFPTRHVELVILSLAMYLAVKDTGRDAAEFAGLKAMYDQHAEAFGKLVGLSMTALASPHGGTIVQHTNGVVTPGAAE